jgi:hypothetical protein
MAPRVLSFIWTPIFVEYLQSSGECSAEICLIFREEPSQPKITNPRLELIVKKNVACFDISVNNSEV